MDLTVSGRFLDGLAAPSGPRASRLRPSVALFLARRGLRESLLSTGLMVAAVAVGIGFEVPAVANLRGYRAELLAQALDNGFGDVRVRPRRGVFIRDADRLAARLEHIPGVTEATPVTGAPVSITGHGHAASLGILAVEPRATYHPYRMVSGLPLGDSDSDGILLGSSLAQRLDVAIGDQVQLRVMLSTYPRLVLDDGGYGVYTMTIRGLVGFGASDSAFVALPFLAAELGDEAAASAVLVHARDHEAAPTIAAAARRVAPDFETRSWMEDSAYLRSSVRAVETLGGASWLLGILAVGIWLLLRGGSSVPVAPSPSAEETTTAPVTTAPPRTTAPPTVTAPAPIAVPDLHGQDYSAAAAALTKLGLVPKRSDEPNTTVPVGKVIDTDPPAGNLLPPGSTVVVSVSSGAPTTRPPTPAPTTTPPVSPT